MSISRLTLLAITALASLAVAQPQFNNDQDSAARPRETVTFVAGPAPTPAPKTSTPGDYPNMPTAFPPLVQTAMIPDQFLKTPLVAEGLARVQRTAPANLLNLPVSKYLSGSTVTYNGDAAANCYWPVGQCLRNDAAPGYNADASKCPSPNAWGITYDDGPTVAPNGQYDTADIRTLLNDLQVKATFFVTGTQTATFPDEVKATYDAGNEIAVHTWTHHPMTSLTNEQIVAELLYTEAAIFKAIGRKTKLFRPPYGDIDDRVRAVASALGYTAVLWVSNRDTLDTTVGADGVNKIVDTAKSWFTAQPGFISLEHDITSTVSEIAVKILEEVKAAGPSFPLKIQPAGVCANLAVYDDAGLAPVTTSTLVATATTPVIDAPNPTSAPTTTAGPQAGQNNKVGTTSSATTTTFSSLFSVTALLALLATLL
ncbi:hypothetical protein DFS34DRAFT_172373 [Phlyctochytrium arcticum]|nr:hypothetical protein DFS34DRAFT_172373 [Phlyctochytrium arcticum]